MEDINKEIEILENVEPYGIIKSKQYDFVNKELYIQAQKNLIKAYKELEEYKKIAELTKISCCIAQNCEALNNSIKDFLENMKLKDKIKELEEENKRLKASHIMTHNKVSDEEKAKIFDVIDNSIDTYFEKSKPYWEQIMTKDKMSLEEAETIINDMYQDRNKILENNNVIDVSRLDDVKFTNLEFASVRAIREIQSLERKLDNSIPVSLVEEKILNPMKEEHDKAIKGFIKRDIPQCIEDGGIAQELGYFIGEIEELLEKRK